MAVVADVAREPGFLSCTSKQLKRFVGLGQSGPSVFISFCSGVCHSISHASGGFSLHIMKLLITSCLFEIRVDRYAHRCACNTTTSQLRHGIARSFCMKPNHLNDVHHEMACAYVDPTIMNA